VNEETIRSARFELESQKTQIGLAERDLEIRRIGFRDKDLIAAGIAVPDDAEEKIKQLVQLRTISLRLEMEAAKRSLDEAAKQLEAARISVANLKITSPADGVIAARYFEEGERIEKAAKLFTLLDSSSLYALIPVREQDAFLIEKGMNADVTIDSTNMKYTGTVSLVASTADSESFMFTVRILLPEEALKPFDDSTLSGTPSGNVLAKPGMFARATIDLGSVRHKLVLNDKSIVNRKNNEGKVYIVHGKILEERNVVFGETVEGEIEIIEGIKEGELVVLRPENNFRNNLQVEVAGENKGVL
jgi:RND family efflux transporter MFP subunit